MNGDLLLVLVLLATCVILFVLNRPRMDVVALLAMIALPLSGVLSVNEALAGFSDPSVVLIAALFVIGDGLVKWAEVFAEVDRQGCSEWCIIEHEKYIKTPMEDVRECLDALKRMGR